MFNKNQAKKQCHDYHLNKCNKKNCKFSHEGLPMNKCIFAGTANNCFRCKSQDGPLQSTLNIKPEEKKEFFKKPNYSYKQCHDYHLKGFCPDQKNCRFSHEGVPMMKCILGFSCQQCTKKIAIINNKCHDYHLNYCKRVNCTFSHEGLPENKCINIGGSKNCIWCQRKDLKECHDYHLNKCIKVDCELSHTGVPQNKCIYGLMCYRCNRACHNFATTGKCSLYKCKFEHISPPQFKCPFGKTNCFFCNFRRVKRKKCHFQQKYGKCELLNCKSSHNVSLTKECANFLCRFCLSEKGQLKNQEFDNQIQDQCQKISVSIDDPNVNPDSLKAAEQVIDDQILSTLTEEQNQNNKSFFPYQINSNKPEQILTACRQILKKFLGYNYVIANDVVQVYVKGEGQIVTPTGQLISMQINQNSIMLKNDNQSIQNDQIYAVKVITRDENYYNQQEKIESNEEEKKLDVDAISQQFKDKQQNKQKSKLKESTILVALQSLNAPILGEFIVDTDQNFSSGYNYSSENQEFGVKELIQQNIKRLEKMSIQPNQNQDLNICQLEIAFVLDTTSSMQPYIDESKNTIIQIIKEIANKVPKTRFSIKYGVVAYRDHPPQDNTYVTQFQNFEESVQKSIEYIQQLSAKGGGDVPEALFDGLFQASNLNWSKDDQSYGGCQRILIHISDAPPHGKIYSQYDDQWKDGCPCKLDIQKISRLFNSQEISYNLLTIGSSLEQTVQIFTKYFQQFDYRDIKKNEANQQTKMILTMLEKFPWWQIA